MRPSFDAVFAYRELFCVGQQVFIMLCCIFNAILNVAAKIVYYLLQLLLQL